MLDNAEKNTLQDRRLQVNGCFSDDSRPSLKFMTGSELVIDGGYTAR